MQIADPSAAINLGIATVFQDLALCENLNVVENLFLGQELSPLRLDEVGMEVKSWELLRQLSARIPTVRIPIASLSGGQRQTVAIARSLLGDPRVIILDEPTAALGVAQTAEVLDLIERLRERGLGVIMISHNMEDVRAVADRVVVLRLGRNNGEFDAHTVSSSERGGSHHRCHRQRGHPAQGPPPGHRGQAVGAVARPRGGGADMSTPPSTMALDQSDERLQQSEGLRGALGSFWRSVRAGDVGALPVVVGLLVIGTIFQIPQPGLPLQRQPGQPDPRLVRGRRDLAGNRVRAARR